MSIATELTALSADVENARQAIAHKGGTVTPNGGTSKLAADIATIPQGGGGIAESEYTFATAISGSDYPAAGNIRAISELLFTDSTKDYIANLNGNTASQYRLIMLSRIKDSAGNNNFMASRNTSGVVSSRTGETNWCAVSAGTVAKVIAIDRGE